MNYFQAILNQFSYNFLSKFEQFLYHLRPFQEIIKFLSYLAEEDLKTKISIIQKLSNTELLAEAKNYQEIIEKKADEVKKFVKTNIEGSKQLLASDFSENELTDFFKDIKDNLLNCIKNSQDFESLLKKLNHSIETALNLKITKERELKVSI